MRRLSDSLFVKRIDKNINMFKIDVFINDSICTFIYNHKNDVNHIWLGGGGQITILKRNCKVLKIIGYQ